MAVAAVGDVACVRGFIVGIDEVPTAGVAALGEKLVGVSPDRGVGEGFRAQEGLSVEGCGGAEVFLGQKNDGAVGEVTPCRGEGEERKEGA